MISKCRIAFILPRQRQVMLRRLQLTCRPHHRQNAPSPPRPIAIGCPGRHWLSSSALPSPLPLPSVQQAPDTSTKQQTSSSSSSSSSTKQRQKASTPRRHGKKKKKKKPQRQQQWMLVHKPHSLYDIETLQKHFQHVASHHELHKLRYLEALNKQLSSSSSSTSTSTFTSSSPLPSTSAPNNISKTQTNSSSSPSSYRDLLDTKILAFFLKRAVPKTLQQDFWKRLLAPHVVDGEGEEVKDVVRRNADEENDHDDDNLNADHVQLFQRAHVHAIQHPWLWNREWKRKVDKKRQKFNSNLTVEGYRTLRSEAIRGQQVEERDNVNDDDDDDDKNGTTNVTAAATTMVRHLQQTLPPRKYDRVVQMIQEYVGDDMADDPVENTTKLSPPFFTLLRSKLVAAVGKGYAHLVATQMASFLHLMVTDSVQDDTNDILHAIVHDPNMIQSRQVYEEAQDKYVQEFQILQQTVWEVYDNDFGDDKSVAEDHDGEVVGVMTTDEPVMDETTTITELQDDPQSVLDCVEEDANAIDTHVENHHDDDINGDDDDDDDPSSEASVLKSFMDVSAIVNPLPTTMDPTKKKPGVKDRPRKYLPFDVMAIGDEWNSIYSDSQHSLPPLGDHVRSDLFASPAFSTTTAPTNRLVFVDNLPIDIDETRLYDAYRRCGPLAAIQVFQKRPDLDPGASTKDARKKIRKPNVRRAKRNGSGLERPRTPLYAWLLFEDETSARTATSDPLRIFGMVLEKHALRSYVAHQMTTLYLEDVPIVGPHEDLASLEYELSRLLHPGNLYVSLEADIRAQSRRQTRHGWHHQQQRRLQYRNCAIQFPSFEAAYWAYCKLSSELDFLQPISDMTTDSDAVLDFSNDASVIDANNNNNDEQDKTKAEEPPIRPGLHWMKTPRDADLYWTRELNF